MSGRYNKTFLDIFQESPIHPTWRNIIESDFVCMEALKNISAMYEQSILAGKRVFPAPENIFRVFEQSPFAVRCVILGQDPYHEAGQAMGLAFSVPNGAPCPPSLRNIKKEIATDIGEGGLSYAPCGARIEVSGTDLTPWAEQGVFLLNTVLTVEEGRANSHAGKDYERFMAVILDRLYKCAETPFAAILWGAQAQKVGGDIENLSCFRPNIVIKSAHPSPLSARRGFFGSRPFSQVNDFLEKHGEFPIDWSIRS